MLPPSDSEEEAEGEEGAEPKPKKEADASTSAAAAGGQSKTAGKMPPSDSEEEDDDDDDDDSDDDPTPEYLRAAPTARKKWVRGRERARGLAKQWVAALAHQSYGCGTVVGADWDGGQRACEHGAGRLCCSAAQRVLTGLLKGASCFKGCEEGLHGCFALP